MARASLRLRPDGIHEIVSQHRTRRLATAAVAVLATAAGGVLAAAALSMVLLDTAMAVLGGTVLTALGLAVLFVRARLRAAGRPLASTIRLYPVRVPLAPDARGARDAGA